jgi:hypothetical protein
VCARWLSQRRVLRRARRGPARGATLHAGGRVGLRGYRAGVGGLERVIMRKRLDNLEVSGTFDSIYQDNKWVGDKGSVQKFDSEKAI